MAMSLSLSLRLSFKTALAMSLSLRLFFEDSMTVMSLSLSQRLFLSGLHNNVVVVVAVTVSNSSRATSQISRNYRNWSTLLSSTIDTNFNFRPIFVDPYLLTFYAKRYNIGDSYGT
jgi:hypothetical protein